MLERDDAYPPEPELAAELDAIAAAARAGVRARPVNREAERLAAEQAALVRALVDGGPVPGGFDPDRVRATSAALAGKRAREVARAWPVLAAELGEDFTGRFLAFAAGRPPPARGGALADGLAFARALARQGRLPAQRPARGHAGRGPPLHPPGPPGRRRGRPAPPPGRDRPPPRPRRTLALAPPRLRDRTPAGWATVV